MLKRRDSILDNRDLKASLNALYVQLKKSSNLVMICAPEATIALNAVNRGLQTLKQFESSKTADEQHGVVHAASSMRRPQQFSHPIGMSSSFKRSKMSIQWIAKTKLKDRGNL